jgi:hypothetical protein
MLFARHVDHKWTLLHDSIISLREVVWARKTSLTLQLFIEVHGDFSLFILHLQHYCSVSCIKYTHGPS